MTTQTVELDPETGFPALPKGYIWRVKSSDGFLTLQLVAVSERVAYYRKWIFWKEEYTHTGESIVEETYLNIHQFAPNSRTGYKVREGLVNLAKGLHTQLIRKQEQRELLESFAGDYPPKNLNSL